MNVWLLGSAMILLPFLIGIFFDKAILFAFMFGFIMIGFFVAINSTMTTGLLKSSKEWMICKYQSIIIINFIS